MSKILFVILSIMGFIIITNLSIIIPNNPFEEIPSLCLFTVNKPIWIHCLFILSSVYFIIIYKIYNCLFNKTF